MPIYDCGAPNYHECQREFRSTKSAIAAMSGEAVLEIEGLAAKLYVASQETGVYVWWHLLRVETKTEFREKAARKIAAFAAEPLPF